MSAPMTIDITITNADGQVFTASAAFTATPVTDVPPGPTPAPVIASVDPATGAATGGTAVTITGQYFQPGATVTFGAFAATDVVVSEDGTTITCVSPAMAQ